MSGVMNQLIASLRQELACLEADLQADPRYRKIAGIRALLDEYGDNEPPRAPTPTVQVNDETSRRRDREPMTGTKKARVREIIRAVLVSRKSAHRGELLKELIDRGIMGTTEKNPMFSLAAYLSEFKEFRNDGLGRWSLANPETVEAPTSEPEGAS